MAKKMYYTEEETAAKLGVEPGELEKYVRDQKLRLYKDGDRKMFKADEVDTLALGAEEIELAPVEGSGDTVSLADADTLTGGGGKEDTVITAEGISIFDDEDLEIETADPMAKTQIAPSLEDQVSLEGVGSGSGLLDLTRESDNTSLGEVLDNIDMEGVAEDEIGQELPATPAFHMSDVPAAAPVYVEEIDAAGGLFGGMIVGVAIVGLLLLALMLAHVTDVIPEYMVGMQQNMVAVIGGAFVIVMIAAIVGYFVGKTAAARSEALRRVGV